jgi:hypothetical protein
MNNSVSKCLYHLTRAEIILEVSEVGISRSQCAATELTKVRGETLNIPETL